MRTHNLYRVTTANGGSVEELIQVDNRYDTPEERAHRAWCKMLENERSPHHRMLMALIKEMGVDRTKAQFCKGLEFEKVA